MSLMVLGTASHVGKSVVTAAILRALSNRGIRAAPFKSQNMSNNSWVCADGGEIGIAQAMQAFAARIEPVTDMNPVLLKPKGDRTSQVVLHGRPYKDLAIRDYYRETGFLLGEAVEAARRLEGAYGQLVVEGAGSAAELNLYDRDIANIRLAESLRIPILLVGDIERGGVFAQICGTLMLLPPTVRSLVMGIVINKFRGDAELFRDGQQKIHELTGLPVLGIIPYTDIPLPSEDSLCLSDKKETKHPVRIAVIRMPHISNFTDFEALEQYASVEYVPPGRSLGGFDCIILPGTKNTVDDLEYLVSMGTGTELHKARSCGIPIIGICGGYQMLGDRVVDSGVESHPGTFEGFGLLGVTTRFSGYEKLTRQVSRKACPVQPILSGMGEVKGYEIHMGETDRGTEGEAFEGEGAVSQDGLVIGTYLHGLFRDKSAINGLLTYLYEMKGLSFAGYRPASDPYDALACHFEAHVRMDEILRCFNGGADAPGLAHETK